MRFTIRDLLWLTVVVALGVGWWIQRDALEKAKYEASRSKYELKNVIDALDRKGYHVLKEEELGTLGAFAIDPPLPRASRRPYEFDSD